MCRRAMNKKPARFQKGGEELLDDGARFKYAGSQDVFEGGVGTRVVASSRRGPGGDGDDLEWRADLESLAGIAEGGGH